MIEQKIEDNRRTG